MTGSVPVQINNLGLRDERDYSQLPAVGCARVLVLGDSMTFGKGVRERDTWPAVLEDLLAAKLPERCIEVLNAGIPNTNFFIQWLHFLERWRSLQPDLVLVGFFVYNDSQLQEDRELYFPGWMSAVDANPVLKGSALVRKLYHRAFLRIGRRLVDEQVPRYFAADYPGWQQFLSSMADLQLVGALDDFRTVVTLIPIPIGYDDYPFADLHQRIFAQLDTELGLPVVDLLDGLKGMVAADHWVHPSDGHPDARLHRRFAEHLAADARWQDWLGIEPDEAAQPSGYQRLAEGQSRAAGGMEQGQRSGPWVVARPAAAGSGQGRAEWGSYEGSQREGPWRLRFSDRGEDGWQVREARGRYRGGQRDGAWEERSSFKAHSSLELQLGDGELHAGPWASQEALPVRVDGRSRTAYSEGQPSGLWLRWELDGRGTERLLSAECFGSGGAQLWEWARAEAPSAAADQRADAHGVMTYFEQQSAPAGDDDSARAELAVEAGSRPLPEAEVESQPCPGPEVGG